MTRGVGDELPLVSPASAGIGVTDLVMVLQSWPAVVEELIGDFSADAELTGRLRLAAIISSGAAGPSEETSQEGRRSRPGTGLGRSSSPPRMNSQAAPFGHGNYTLSDKSLIGGV